MAIPIQAVAHEILQQNKKASRKTTPLQLIKLAYLAHGWHLAFFGEPLFPDKVEAWTYGPVLPHLYREIKHFGRNPINTDLFSDVVAGVEISSDQQHAIDEVMQVYGEYDGIALSAMTHETGTPWDKTPQGDTISNELIQSHFNKLMTQNEDD